LSDFSARRPIAHATAYDQFLESRPNIDMAHPQAAPRVPSLDRDNCVHFKTGDCGLCAKVCQAGAIDYEQNNQQLTLDVGAIVLTPGYQTFQASRRIDYGSAYDSNVLTHIQYERILSASGPTQGHLVRPSDHKQPQNIAWLQCVGSRDVHHCDHKYCSGVCCMYAIKEAVIAKEHEGDNLDTAVFYMDIRSGGKGYDEFVRRAIEQDGANYYRGRVSKITEEKGKLIVRGADTLAGLPVTIEADLVVLAAAMRPAEGIEELAQKLNIGCDEFGFLMESHPKLRPVETNTAGIFIAGACQAPKDIPEAVAQASAAASKVQVMLAADELTREPEIAAINEQTCAACFTCVHTCPYHAIERAEVRTGRGVFIKRTARVNAGLCMGCGTCVSVCPSKSADLLGFTDQEVYAMVESLV